MSMVETKVVDTEILKKLLRNENSLFLDRKPFFISDAKNLRGVHTRVYAVGNVAVAVASLNDLKRLEHRHLRI
jgi:hypothetical protein